MRTKRGMTIGWLAAIAGMWLAGAMPAGAGDGTWTNLNSGFWNTSGNWSGGNVANGAGSTANISANIAAARRITNDTAVTLGTLNIGDSNNTSAYTLTNSTGSLTFDSGSGAGTFLNFYSTSFGDTLAAAFNVADSGGLTISNASGSAQTISGVISGSKLTVNNSGAGKVTLSGVNTFNGGVTLNGGVLSVNTITNGGVAGNLGQASSDAANLVINGGELQWGANDTSDRGITIGLNGGTLYPLNACSALTLTGPLAFSGSGPRTLQLATYANNKVYSWNADIGDNGGPTSLIISNRHSAAGDSGWTLSGNRTFSGGLTLAGGCALVLGGTQNNFSGGVTVGPGSTLNCGAGASAVTLTNDIANNGTIGVVSGNGNVTYSGVISGTGSAKLGFSSAATATLGGTNNSYTGITKISGNAATYYLQVSKLANGGQNSSIGASSSAASNLVLGVNSGAGSSTILRYVGQGDSSDRLFTLMNNGNTTFAVQNNGTGALNFTSTGSIAYGTADRPSTFNLAGTYKGIGTFAPAIANNGTGVISFTKSGAGTWVLTGTNTYSGVTTISGGALGLMGEGTLGSGNLTINGGLLESSNDIALPLGTGSGQMQITGGASGFSAKDNAIKVAFGTVGSPTALVWGAATFAPATLVFNSAFADSKLTFLNPIDLNNTASAVTRTIQVNTNVAELTGALTKSGSGSLGITKTGNGTLKINGVGTALTNANGALTVTAGTLDFNGYNASITTLTMGGGATGTTSSILTGSGTLTISNTATYSGNTANDGGATISGKLNFVSGANHNFTVNNSTAVVNDLSVSADMSGGDIGNPWRKAGAGTLSLSGSNTYSMPTYVDAGVLRLDSANALPGGIGTSGGGSHLLINGGVVGLGAGDFTRGLTPTRDTTPDKVMFYGTASGGWAAYGADRFVNLGGASVPVKWNDGMFAGAGARLILGTTEATHRIDFQNPINLNAATRTILVDDNPAVDTDFAMLSGAVTNGALVKMGAGRLVLAGGTNRFTGTGLTVSNGTLVVNGATTSSVMTVSGGVALINGLYTGPVTVAPGASLGGTGTVDSAKLTLNAGAKLSVTVYADGTSDALTVSGALDVSSLSLEVVNTKLLNGAYKYAAVRCGSHIGTFVSDNLPAGWVVDYGLTGAIRIRRTPQDGMIIIIR